VKGATRFHPSLVGLLEVGLLFLPAIPAYLWIWPNVSGTALEIWQILVYLYVIAGTVFIGRRRYNWRQLGLNRQGIWLGLGCAVVLLVARLLIILGIDWTVHPAPFTWLGFAGKVLFYIGLVGLGEELLFRGLVYRLLADWGGARWAIWGSSLGFGLWHIFGQGPLAGLATLLIGLLFALIRWRGGGIIGLIILHGLWDLETVLLVADSNPAILNAGAIAFKSEWLVWLGTLLLLLVPVYVWKLHPCLAGKVGRWLNRAGHAQREMRIDE
jgi:membrane protease YdiL (CAAX protease family)